jgi:hypothetical protein
MFTGDPEEIPEAFMEGGEYASHHTGTRKRIVSRLAIGAWVFGGLYLFVDCVNSHPLHDLAAWGCSALALPSMASPGDVNPWVHCVDVTVPRPRLRRGRRALIGIAWEKGSVVVGKVFAGYPGAGLLVPGDEILTLDGNPVHISQDVVYHWERAAPGVPVRFSVRRHASHIVGFRGETRIQWASDRAPLVGALLRRLPSTPSGPSEDSTVQALQPGDMVIAVQGRPVALPAEVDAALRERQASGVDGSHLAVVRGLTSEEEADETCNVCACLWRTPVPRAARRRGRRLDEAFVDGEVVLECA